MPEFTFGPKRSSQESLPDDHDETPQQQHRVQFRFAPPVPTLLAPHLNYQMASATTPVLPPLLPMHPSHCGAADTNVRRCKRPVRTLAAHACSPAPCTMVSALTRIGPVKIATLARSAGTHWNCTTRESPPPTRSARVTELLASARCLGYGTAIHSPSSANQPITPAAPMRERLWVQTQPPPWLHL